MHVNIKNRQRKATLKGPAYNSAAGSLGQRHGPRMPHRDVTPPLEMTTRAPEDRITLKSKKIVPSMQPIIVNMFS